MALNITDDSFENDVLKSDLPVLVDFWAEWCGPCRMVAPILEQISSEMASKIKVAKMNIDENPNTPSNLGIRSIPTMIIFKAGKPVSTKVGLSPKESIEAWIEESI